MIADTSCHTAAGRALTPPEAHGSVTLLLENLAADGLGSREMIKESRWQSSATRRRRKNLHQAACG